MPKVRFVPDESTALSIKKKRRGGGRNPKPGGFLDEHTGRERVVECGAPSTAFWDVHPSFTPGSTASSEAPGPCPVHHDQIVLSNRDWQR